MIYNLKRLREWTRSPRVSRWLAFLLTVATIFFAIATYVAIARSKNPFGPDPQQVTGLLLIDFILLVALFFVISRRAFSLWRSLRRSTAGSQLQTRILLFFSLLTILPALLVSVFAVFFLHVGIQSWFNQRVSVALEQSVAVAQAYLAEHQEILRGDAIAMATELDLQAHRMITNPSVLAQIISKQAALRSITEGIIIQRNRIIAQTPLSFALAFEQIDSDKQERARSGEVVMWVSDEDKLRAMLKLHSMPDTYLVIGRLIDEKVLKHMDNTTGAVSEYRRLRDNTANLQVQFSLVFGAVVLLLLLLAIWVGMRFAARLVVPITRLIRASERVSGGDFDSKVPVDGQDDEIATLGRAFNLMTDELARQRADLVQANIQIDERRRFSEAVLAGVSAGVIAVEADKKISLYNRTAQQLLDIEDDAGLNDRNIEEILPALRELLAKAEAAAGKLVQQEITIKRKGKNLTLLVRIAAERYQDLIEGYIITFDDITQLVAAQRNAAWSDVARRVAHEIKNPLTPIQLATERLRRKYSKQIQEDELQAYERYLDTITRHVADIGKMVEEFVTFARMPTPVFQSERLDAIIRKVIFSEQVAHPSIKYDLVVEAPETQILADAQQLARVFTNLLKNAAEAIEQERETAENLDKGIITLRLSRQDNFLVTEIRDNGPGFPEEILPKLMEPYVTTREKGTGLGLAIVKKIIEDHQGQMTLTNRLDKGALVTVIFPIDSDKNVT